MDQNRILLFVAVHPDDETLGCGGTLFLHSSKGDEIYWLIVTGISEEYGYSLDQVQSRQKEIEDINSLYKFNGVYNLCFPTTEVDRIPQGQLISKISKVINEVRPEILYVPNRSDIHTDHQETFKAVMSSTKNFRFPFVNKLLMCETLSETETALPLPENSFMPNVFIDVSDTFQRKLEAMKVYKDELMDKPMPRSLDTIDALARYRGSRIGVNYVNFYAAILEELAMSKN